MSTTQSLKPQWFQILLALADHELHGLGIMKEVLDQTDGQMRLWPAMLYGSLKKMVDVGLVEETEGPAGPGADTDRRRFYAITDAGRDSLAAEVARLTRYVQVAQKKDIASESARP
jgi:DNA-binding PadR family transcriptional regulator